MMLKISAYLFFLFTTLTTFAQTVTISGYVTDASSGEALIGASVYETHFKKGTVSNQYGFYSLTLPTGKVSLAMSYLGYQTGKLEVELRKDTAMTLRLTATTQALKEVTVTGQDPHQAAPLGLVTIPIERLRAVPSLLGEPDVIKALALTPGVSVGNEGTTGLLVRGGTPDQNLILLDEATVYNASHLFGFVSVFNPDAIKKVDLYKAGFPARFGGRLSSIIDITMKEGNNQEMRGEASVGLISSRFYLEGPIRSEKTSFMVAARSSYLSLFLLPNYISFRRGSSSQYFNYWLYDVNAKINHQFKDGSRLFFSVYNGNDFWRTLEGSRLEGSKFRLHWGNTTATTRYSRVLNPKLFFRSVLTYTRYGYGIEGGNYAHVNGSKVTTNGFDSQSSVRDLALKAGFEFFPSSAHQIKFGTEVINHGYQPTSLRTTEAINADTLRKANAKINAWEYAAYAEDEIRLTPWLSANAGLRGTAFNVQSQTYTSLEPRLAVNFMLPYHFALKGSYSAMRQYIHLLSNNGAGLPNDIWVPATRRVPPQFSRQIAFGLTKTLPRINMEITIEGYRKTMNNLIDYKQGANLLTGAYNQDWQEQIEKGGIGEAYGIEFFLNRTKGRFTGWLSYTLSWNQRKFTNINEGDWYAARYDRRHNIAITGNYRLSDKWSLSGTWVYSTGQPVTLPSVMHEDIDGNKILVYTGRNNVRMPSYHRLDLGANYTFETRRGRVATWSFGVYNAYNRANPFYLDFKDVYEPFDPYNPPAKLKIAEKKLVLKSFLPFLPSVSYSFKF